MTTQPATHPLELFYSYAPEDEQLRQTLDKHLTMLRHQGLITGWYQHLITAGTETARESMHHLNTARIILLLISPDYLASDYCYGTEIQRAMQRHEAGEACIIPILLRHCYYTGTPFEKLHSLPTNGKPITAWPDRDEAFALVAREIHKAIEELTLTSIPTPGHEQHSSSQPIWNIPYSRNPFFTGREQLLTRLRTNLTTTKSAALTQAQAISGLGGIGKTQTAVEYAYRYREQYRDILWASASSRETLGLELVKLAGLLPLSLPATAEQNLTVTAVKNWLSQHQDWLLILDNADDLSIAYDFLPERSSTNGHVLLTTRADVVGTLANPLAVEKMDTEEGILLLLRRARLLAADAQLPQASSYDRTQAASIVREMDGLPLALDQAGAYIEETSCPLADYLALYRTHRKDLLGHRSKYRSDHSEPVATTWDISFQEVEKANPAAADLLRLCSFLDPDAIPEDLLSAGASQLPSPLQPLAADLFKLNAAIEVLRRYSLIKRNPTTKTLAIHRLVQAVLKDAMNEETQMQWAERVVRVVSEAFPDVTDIATWLRCRRYLPHVQACAMLIEQDHLQFSEAALLLHQAGYYLQAQGQYVEAEPFYQQALVIYEQVKGADHSHTAATLHELGRLAQAQGEYSQAQGYYRRALSIYEQSLPANHPSTAATLHALGALAQDQGEYSQAQAYYRRALSIKEQSLPANHPSTAATLHQLAVLYENQERYEEAEPLYLRSLTIYEKLLPNHPHTAIMLDNYAGFLRKMKREGEAVELERRARAIRDRLGS